MTRFVLLVIALLCVPSALAQAPAESAPVTAPSEAAHPAGAVIVVRQLNHARAAVRTAEALRANERFGAAPIELVVCGSGSTSILADSADAAPLVRAAEQAGVRLLACGMSLSKLGIDAAALAEGIDVVPNGLLHALLRQADGFLSVEL